jgi:RimJ/RimL family protein N-acetyltransferase
MEFKLRPWKTDDLESVTRHADNPQITSFMSDEFPTTMEGWKKFIEFATQDKTILYLAIDIGGQTVGAIGIHPQKGVLRRNAELGYWISEAYRGQGIMTRAIKEMVTRAFDTFDIHRIYAKPFGNNPASHRVLEKAGFRLEARFENVIIKNGEILDECVYAIRRNNDARA